MRYKCFGNHVRFFTWLRTKELICGFCTSFNHFETKFLQLRTKCDTHIKGYCFFGITVKVCSTDLRVNKAGYYEYLYHLECHINWMVCYAYDYAILKNKGRTHTINRL